MKATPHALRKIRGVPTSLCASLQVGAEIKHSHENVLQETYLFCGSNAGGERAAAIYALLGSAKLNGLDPEIYLHQVLERIADHPITQIAELLPWNVTINTPTITPQA